MKNKLEQINGAYKKAIAQILLKEFSDKQPLGVSDVLIDPSYLHGRVWLKTTPEIRDLVESKRAEIQAQLKRYVKTRYTPKLSFLIEDDYLEHLDDLFEALEKSDED